MKKLFSCLNIFFIINLSSLGYQIKDNFTGQITKKYKNGQIYSIQNFKNGKLHGEFKEFFKSGNLSQIGTFKNGDLESIKVFYETGELKFEQKLKNRKGIYKAYYPNGQLEEEGKVFQGEEIGVWKFYDSNGKLLKIKKY